MLLDDICDWVVIDDLRQDRMGLMRDLSRRRLGGQDL